ncbi:hypothetical protein D9M73_284230 [compost metagenome]
MVPPFGASASTASSSGLEPASRPMETFCVAMMFSTTASCWLTLMGYSAVYLLWYSRRAMLASKAPVSWRTRSCRMSGKRTSNGSDRPLWRSSSTCSNRSIGALLGPLGRTSTRPASLMAK